jgi:hypothetical protein
MCAKLGQLWAGCRELHDKKINFKCYHTKLDNEENFQTKREEFERLKSSLEELTEDIIEESNHIWQDGNQPPVQ